MKIRERYRAYLIRILKRICPFWNPRYTTQGEVTKLIELIGSTRGPIVEIGCNEGATTRVIAKAFPTRQVIGVDCSSRINLAGQGHEQPKRSRVGCKAKGIPM